MAWRQMEAAAEERVEDGGGAEEGAAAVLDPDDASVVDVDEPASVEQPSSDAVERCVCVRSELRMRKQRDRYVLSGTVYCMHW